MVQANDHGNEAAVERSARPDLLRGLTEPRYSRRRFVRGAAGLIAAGSLAGVISACGIAGTRDTGWKDGFDWKGWWSEQEQARLVRLRQLAALHGPRQGRLAELKQFTEGHRHHGQLPPVIQDNAACFAQDPAAARRRPVDRLRPGGDHQRHRSSTQMLDSADSPLDHSGCRTSQPRGPATRPSFDPGNVYSVPWAVGHHRHRLRPARTSAARSPASRTSGTRPSRARSACSPTPRSSANFGMLAVGVNPADLDPGRLAAGPPTSSSSSATRASCASTTTRATSTPSARATSGSRRRGRATSSRRTSPTART